ncbi:HDL498Wp [Eremothecium sinecaudum]|uniref:HDL498Wp n=1 Tax=Eremothecium sinecaudum TaxID=45286 RepID=A0A0X8HQR7_9SACH|nr:HDL498Wp [Eremothecium sinecaudum]AMD20246.1 HDL498Wp [Eremothecium sinecaudum]
MTSLLQHKDSEVFSIAGQGLKLTSKEEIQSHLDNLAKYGSVTKIDLSGNTIGIDASAALATHLESSDVLRDSVTEVNFADLYTSRLVDEVVESLNLLLPVLLKYPKLEAINLSDNAFGLRTIDILEKYISNAVNLRHLILANNGMGPFAGERIGKALYALAKRKEEANKPMLETFVCGRNRLENGSTKWLAVGLKQHGDGLKTVRLYQNGIRPSGIATLLMHGLQHNKKLEVLDLQDNTFTTGGSNVLAAVLPQWKDTLKELNVNDCLLKADGSDAVVKAMLDNKFGLLEVLKLQYNEMVQKTLECALIPSLEKGNLAALKTLELNGNRLEEDSEALDTLQAIFKGELDELDDLEEVDSEEEEEADSNEEEELEEFDVNALEKELDELHISSLADKLSNTNI